MHSCAVRYTIEIDVRGHVRTLLEKVGNHIRHRVKSSWSVGSKCPSERAIVLVDLQMRNSGTDLRFAAILIGDDKKLEKFF